MKFQTFFWKRVSLKHVCSVKVFRCLCEHSIYESRHAALTCKSLWIEN